ncbi:MAG: surface lipoprotein assembly modifier [Rhodobacter sp.]|nr:surface lipoprotein assembly modifier [Rhodobacter sp.]
MTLARALLRRDPRDVGALVLVAAAARNLGDYDTARDAGQAAWRLAETDPQRYAAALVTAQALSSDDRRTMAQLWLRRAVDVAPSEVARGRAVRDFRYVRARNPWSMQLSFNIAPSNNINNGSLRETTTLFVLGADRELILDGKARALSGTEYSGTAAIRYRFDESERHAQDLLFQVDHRSYVLSSDAKAQAPGTTGSDFAFTQVAAGYVYRATPETGLGPYSLNATVGQNWYGGDAYFSYLRIGGEQKIKLGRKAHLSFYGSAERQFGERASDADVLRGDVVWTRMAGAAGVLSLSVGATGSESVSETSDYSELRAGAGFTLAKPVMGARVSFGLEWRNREFPRSSLDPLNGRDDREVSASVDLVFTEIERYGFNPTLSVLARRTESNIGLYDSEELGVRFGIRSAF